MAETTVKAKAKTEAKASEKVTPQSKNTTSEKSSKASTSAKAMVDKQQVETTPKKETVESSTNQKVEVTTQQEQKKSVAKTTTKKPSDKAKQEVRVPKKAEKTQVPSVETMLEAGVQFGHETKRWNPLMRDYIFGSKGKIHVIDVIQTTEFMKKALDFLVDAASRGEILMVGTKNQAAEIVRREAIRSGSYFVDKRWAGGLLTNFDVVRKSLNKLNSLEKQFSEGIQGRTKFEISQMKKEWARLDRLYAGIKSMQNKPVAAIVVDINFEKGALRECTRLGIPVVALVDTNVNPELVNYPVPSNDDAVSVLELMLTTFADAIVEGNEGKGVKHSLIDYTEEEIKIIKTQEELADESEVVAESTQETPMQKKIAMRKPAKKVSKKAGESKGILERVQKEKEQK